MTMEPAHLDGNRACSVIIPTWKRADLLREVLDSLEAQTSPVFEVVIVSDGEDEATRALADGVQFRLPIAWYFHDSNRGQAAARNTGAKNAHGDILLFLDDDTLANPTLVEKHLAHHNRAGSIAVAGRITEQRINPITRPTDRFLQANWEKTLAACADRLSATGIDSVGEDFEAGLAFGLNCSIARRAFLQSGGFTEALRTTDEDMEMGIRLYRAGINFVFEPDAVVTHRSAKELTDYLRNCWNASGKSDVVRVFELNQKNSQTSRLVSMHNGSSLHRLAGRALWLGTDPLLALANRLESAADATGSSVLLRAWGRIAPTTTYWHSVKSTGCTLDELQRAAGQPKRALALHSISAPHTPEESRYYLSPDHFKRFLRWFHDAGYKSATSEEWLNGNLSDKQVLLTFDDGYDDLYTEMFPLVSEYGLTALVLLVSSQIGGANVWDQKNGLRARTLLSVAQVREMQQYGIEFGSHTVSHRYLPEISDADLQREVVDSKRRLEDLLGIEITSFAYPYGGVDRRVRSAVISAGYRQGFTTLPGANWWNDPFTQHRAEINDYTSMLDFKWKIRTGLGFTASAGKHLRNVERTIPTASLRKLAGKLARGGHNVVQSRSSEVRGRMD
jgi:peptidoglycan/xylan/chitin deacetylase (PgdA/CDA1 family)/glycosyltransferase involved in cell wall biosynthesis